MKIRLMVATGLLVMLSACAALGLSTPKGFDQQLAEAYGVHTAVVQTADQSVNAGSLSKEDGKRVYQLAQDSRGVLDAAKAAELAGDQAGAQRNLVLALTGLQALQTFLTSKGVK